MLARPSSYAAAAVVCLALAAQAAPIPQEGSESADAALDTSVTTSTDTSADDSAAGSSQVSAWQRPNKPSFDGVVAPFVPVDQMDYYILGEGGSATTIVAQKEVTVSASSGAPASTATVGNVIIYDEENYAEAIGALPTASGDAQGELYDAILCSPGEAGHACDLIDYDGSDAVSTYHATLSGATEGIPVQPIESAPAGLKEWAENAITLERVTLTRGAEESGDAAAATPTSTSEAASASPAAESPVSESAAGESTDSASASSGSLVADSAVAVTSTATNALPTATALITGGGSGEDNVVISA